MSHLAATQAPGGIVRSIAERLDRPSLAALVGGVSFLLYLLHHFDHVLLRAVLGAVLLAYVFERRTLTTAWVWALIALTSSYILVQNWEDTGNHNYIITYWGWVLALAYLIPRVTDDVVRFNARFFLVFIFLVAVLQKTLSPSYLSGEMFEMKLLRSEGFRYFALTFGIDASILHQTRELTGLLLNPAVDVAGNAVRVPSDDRIQQLAVWVTWYDYLIQVAIGLAFLSRARAVEGAAHVLLLFFIFTAYVWIPITGFGWSIAMMGLVLSKGRFPGLHLVYVLCLFALTLFHLPWGMVFLRIASL